MVAILKKIFGTEQTRKISKYLKLVKQVKQFDEQLSALSDELLKQKTEEFRHRLKSGETTDDILAEAYAVVKNACRRLCGTEVHVSGYSQKWDMVPYDVQIVGAIAMHYGAIAEMQTGEGKTLTASMPLYLNALTGGPTHLVTVNDYLASRDCDWIGAIFRFLGLTVSSLTQSTPHHLRKQVYASDVVYGTASEFGFDYLRDNSMVQSRHEQSQRGHYFAIIDEVDSILIDEARTPLIISGPASGSTQMYDTLKEDVAALVKLQRDFCTKLASEAKKALDTCVDKTKKEQEQKAEALKSLWVVSKGMPQNKILKKIKEDPDMRAELDRLETYFHAEPNKEQRHQELSVLYIIVDEKASEYELTDKGIQSWIASAQNAVSSDDFIMLDLGYEYSCIENDTSLDEEQKLSKKVALREEDARRKERSHNLRQMLRAHLLMEKDIDYIVDAGKIVIIDENTGRPQPGRRFSDGLHQAIEAKEGVAIQGETQTYATITLQNYFRMYHKLAGMTGTAMTEAAELKEIYKLEVVAIPTHRPCKRVDADDEIYMTEREKYNAIIKDILSIHKLGRPILIGTESVEVSEKLSRILKQNKLEHTVLNAKNHAKEAEIIAEAGKAFAITVATNMAGRGTDIKLKEGVAETGGLHVIGTTRHQSRRIDRQLRGRCARLGDPGSSKFYVSFEDTLMRLFTSPKVTAFLQRFRPPEGEAISAKVLNKSIETAQKRVEQRNYTMRKHTLEYDDVMNKQRVEIYAFRNEVLSAADTITLAKELLESVCLQLADRYLTKEALDVAGYSEALASHLPIAIGHDLVHDKAMSIKDIEDKAIDAVHKALQTKIHQQEEAIAKIHEQLGHEASATSVLHEVIRSLLLRHIDKYWQAHLLNIDYLRSEVHLRVIGQKDPLIEFKHEAFALFEAFSLKIKTEIAHALFKFEVLPPPPAEKIATPRRSKPSSKAISLDAITIENQEEQPFSQER